MYKLIVSQVIAPKHWEQSDRRALYTAVLNEEQLKDYLYSYALKVEGNNIVGNCIEDKGTVWGSIDALC